MELLDVGGRGGEERDERGAFAVAAVEPGPQIALLPPCERRHLLRIGCMALDQGEGPEGESCTRAATSARSSLRIRPARSASRSRARRHSQGPATRAREPATAPGASREAWTPPRERTRTAPAAASPMPAKRRAAAAAAPEQEQPSGDESAIPARRRSPEAERPYRGSLTPDEPEERRSPGVSGVGVRENRKPRPGNRITRAPLSARSAKTRRTKASAFDAQESARFRRRPQKDS